MKKDRFGYYYNADLIDLLNHHQSGFDGIATKRAVERKELADNICKDILNMIKEEDT